MARGKVRAALAPVWILLGGICGADEYHYANMPAGDRAAGMGGAYTAVSDDPAGLYYNPAGIVYSQGRSLSASMNSYQSVATRYKGVLAGNDWERRSSALLPNFFGIVQPLGKGVAGFSYAVPDSINEDQDQIFSGLPANIDGDTSTPETVSRYVINFNHATDVYQLGPSYAWPVNETFSVGLSLYGHYRSEKLIVNQLVEMDSSEDGNQDGETDVYEWRNTYLEKKETGVRPVLGVLWNGPDKLALGATVSQIYVLEASTRAQNAYKGVDPAYDGSFLDFSVARSGASNDYPVAVTAGAAYFSSRTFLIAADASFHTATREREATWNAALGLERYFSNRWAVRAGVYTDHANTPDLSPSVSGQAPHVDRYGASVSVSRFTRNSSITLGVIHSAGRGDAQIIAGSAAISQVSERAYAVFLSASYSY